ncbi:MAG: ABC transporter ATP-binding protein [Bacillota bacterium]
MLIVEKLKVSYSGVPAVHDVSFRVPEGNIVAMVGSNGAGKSTTMRAIAGLIRPDSGNVSLLGQCIDGLAPHEIVGRGISLVPEGRRIFGKLTVMENLILGAYTVASRDAVEESLKAVFSIFPILEERKVQRAGTLSGGEQSMLTVARALMARPRLMMLDEPSLGLMPVFVDRVFDLIREINERGTTVLLVEQNVRASLELADYAYVLQNGRTVLEGDSHDLLESELVKRSYLGM